MERDKFEKSYEDMMQKNGLVICIFPCGPYAVSYHYQRKAWAGQQVGWKTDRDGNRVALHAVKYLEGDSYAAMGRLLHPVAPPPPLLDGEKKSKNNRENWEF